MKVVVRISLSALLVLAAFPAAAEHQDKPSSTVAHHGKGSRRPVQTIAAVSPVAASEPAPALRPGAVLVGVTLADIGFANGLRFANLGGRRELFLPLPQAGDVAATELVLALDDISAHEAKRSLEIQINDRPVAAVALDGKSRSRTVRIALGRMQPRDGFLKLSFVYSGAATLDRCIDVRYVGDSVTVRPETAVEVEIGAADKLDPATTAMLMPRDVAIVLPTRRLTESEIATALTVARSLIAGGRRVAFQHGYGAVAELAKSSEPERWTRGIILIGPLDEASAAVDPPLVRLAGPGPDFGTLAAIRVGGFPALLVSGADVVRAGRFFASPYRAATRGTAGVTIGAASAVEPPRDRVSFAELGVGSVEAEVFGRADLLVALDMRRLPPETRASRLLLDLNVAPDGAGEKAVVSAFVNERLLGSVVAATGETTRLDLRLPDGLIGPVANVRALVQRDSARGDCRFEPQGYPAQLLESSSLELVRAEGAPHDFSDLMPRFAHGLELLLPTIAADQPNLFLGLVAELLDQLSSDDAPLSVHLISAGVAPAPNTPFITVSANAPVGVDPRVRFDRGRIVVSDRSGRTLLDLGSFSGGAVAQVVDAAGHSGVWVKPLSADGAVPAPTKLHLDRGNVAFIDGNGVALAMSTERDTVVRISYPEQTSWLTVAERFRSWIIGALWLLATVALLFALQRVLRRRPARGGE
jgi:cellulose synthase operon protein B